MLVCPHQRKSHATTRSERGGEGRKLGKGRKKKGKHASSLQFDSHECQPLAGMKRKKKKRGKRRWSPQKDWGGEE